MRCPKCYQEVMQLNVESLNSGQCPFCAAKLAYNDIDSEPSTSHRSEMNVRPSPTQFDFGFDSDSDFEDFLKQSRARQLKRKPTASATPEPRKKMKQKEKANTYDLENRFSPSIFSDESASVSEEDEYKLDENLPEDNDEREEDYLPKENAVSEIEYEAEEENKTEEESKPESGESEDESDSDEDTESEKDETPKRRPSAFLNFNQAMRGKLSKEHKGLSQKTLSKLVSVMWNRMSKEQKSKYHNHDDFKSTKIVKPPCANGYILFSGEQIPTLLNQSKVSGQEQLGITSSIVSFRWKSLSEQEKQAYHQRAKQIRIEWTKKYPVEYQSYLNTLKTRQPKK